MRIPIVVILVVSFSSLCFSATLHVPSQFSTIQDAIDASTKGDTVLVAAGVYYENIRLKGKSILVKSIAGPKTTIINGSSKGSCAVFTYGPPPNSTLMGFTLMSGSGESINNYDYGGGIYVADYATPTIINNIIIDNIAKFGGGIFCDIHSSALIQSNTVSNNHAYVAGGVSAVMSSSIIRNNLISKNTSESSGGGVNCTGPNAVIVENNVISENQCMFFGGGILSSSGNHIITNNLIIKNRSEFMGGGVYLNHDALLMNNTIAENIAVSGAGGVYGYVMGQMTNCIVWNNVAPVFPEIATDNITVIYSNIKGGYPGIGNINSDPLFYNPLINDFHLKQDPCQPGVTNPCVDSGSDTAVKLGLDTSWTRTDGVFDSGMADMGYHYLEPHTTGGFSADIGVLSQTTGGKVKFTIKAGSSHAGRSYLIFSGVSGTSPGFTPPPGLVTIPVNWDVFTNLALKMVNTTLFSNFYGVLNQNGQASAEFNTLGPFTGGAGLTLNFAFGLDLTYWDYASNPVTVHITP